MYSNNYDNSRMYDNGRNDDRDDNRRRMYYNGRFYDSRDYDGRMYRYDDGYTCACWYNR